MMNDLNIPPKDQHPTESGQNTLKNEFQCNYLVDENSAHIDVPEDKVAVTAHHHEDSVGATGPTNWWQYGIALMAILIILMIILQMATGGGVTPSA